MKWSNISRVMVVMTACCLTTTGAFAERYGQELRLTGSAETTKISGFAGSKSRVGVPDSQADDYAVFGLSSEERRDHPCYVTIRTENINDSGKKLDLKKDFCGKKEKSSAIEVEYSDAKYEKRVFVTGTSVCMNNDNTRVKGLRIRGAQLSDTGDLVDLKAQTVPDHKGPMPAHNTGPTSMPTDDRANCNNNWKKWAECPGGQIATAAILHFEAGKEPRSLTGIALECRRVGLPGTGAVRAQ